MKYRILEGGYINKAADPVLKKERELKEKTMKFIQLKQKGKKCKPKKLVKPKRKQVSKEKKTELVRKKTLRKNKGEINQDLQEVSDEADDSLTGVFKRINHEMNCLNENFQFQLNTKEGQKVFKIFKN